LTSLDSLLVIVPIRGRRANCERMLESFAATATCSDITFISDPDDQDTYDGIDWGPAHHAVLDPRGTVVEKLNHRALAFAESYDALMCAGDDCVFETPGWDRLLLDTLESLGGSGITYPDDKRRSDVPELWVASSDVVQALGWFANPVLGMYYTDNSWAELGKRAGLIRWCPEAVVRHLHYSVTPGVEKDDVYRDTEDKWGAPDLQAFHEWRGSQMGNEVAVLRRQFSPDVAWVLSRV